MAEDKNHYQVLQVDPSAGQDIITAAYKQLAKAFHPDVNKSPEANRAMQRINLAYQVLSDPLQRARYDRELQEQRASQNPPGKGAAGQTQTYSSSQRNPDIRYSDIRYSDNGFPFQGAGPAAPEDEDRAPEWLKRERARTTYRQARAVRATPHPKRGKARSALRLGWIILYIVFASVLFLIFGLQANSLEGVIVILVVALILVIPIAFRLDDYLRK